MLFFSCIIGGFLYNKLVLLMKQKVYYKKQIRGDRMKIGKKLKELRTQNGLTLEELANRSELTKGFLSQLERDLTSPNISALENILEALGTNLADFFQSSKEEQIVFHTQDFFVNEQDDLVTEYIIPNAQKNQMEPLLLTLKPGAKSQDVKAHEGEEFGYVLKGSVVLVVGNKRLKVKSKETFYITGKEGHYLENVSSADAKVLWVSTPPVF